MHMSGITCLSRVPATLDKACKHLLLGICIILIHQVHNLWAGGYYYS